MSYSLQSRDLIADSIETTMGAQWYDANVSIPGCDKNMPGTIIAMGRLNRPSLMIYGGTIKPGYSQLSDDPIDIVSAFQSYGKHPHPHPRSLSPFSLSQTAVYQSRKGSLTCHVVPQTHGAPLFDKHLSIPNQVPITNGSKAVPKAIAAIKQYGIEGLMTQLKQLLGEKIVGGGMWGRGRGGGGVK